MTASSSATPLQGSANIICVKNIFVANLIPDAADTSVSGLRCDRWMLSGKTEVEARQTGSLLLYHSVQVSPVAQSDGQLVDQHPDEDEEETTHDGEEGEGCLERVLAIAEHREVEDLVEAARKAS